MQSGWRVGSILGIPLFIDRSWFLILLLVTLSYGLEPAWHSNWGNLAWVMGFALALLLFGSVLLHELGHSIAAKLQGIGVNSITLFLFGGIASIDKESKTPGDALKVAIAGPLVSFGLFLLLTGLAQVPGLPDPVSLIMLSVAQINLVLTLFNLIPGLPLDGGQVLKALVWKVTSSRIQEFAGLPARGRRWAGWPLALGCWWRLSTKISLASGSRPLAGLPSAMRRPIAKSPISRKPCWRSPPPMPWCATSGLSMPT